MLPNSPGIHDDVGSISIKSLKCQDQRQIMHQCVNVMWCAEQSVKLRIRIDYEYRCRVINAVIVLGRRLLEKYAGLFRKFSDFAHVAR